MSGESKEIELFDSRGDFTVLLTMHMKRYSAEMDLSIHDIVSLFRDSGISKKQMIFISLSGYESTKRTIEALRTEEVCNGQG